MVLNIRKNSQLWFLVPSIEGGIFAGHLEYPVYTHRQCQVLKVRRKEADTSKVEWSWQK